MKKLEQNHEILLHLLDELPEEEAMILRKELLGLYHTLQVTQKDLGAARLFYEGVAAQVRIKASVHKRKLMMKDQ